MDIALDQIDINQCDANVPLFSNANRCKPETTKVRLCPPVVTYSRIPSCWVNFGQVFIRLLQFFAFLKVNLI